MFRERPDFRRTHPPEDEDEPSAEIMLELLPEPAPTMEENPTLTNERVLLPSTDEFPTAFLQVTAPRVSLHPITMLYTPALNLGHTSREGKKLTGIIALT
jgi:hypothetical protein